MEKKDLAIGLIIGALVGVVLAWLAWPRARQTWLEDAPRAAKGIAKIPRGGQIMASPQEATVAVKPKLQPAKPKAGTKKTAPARSQSPKETKPRAH